MVLGKLLQLKLIVMPKDCVLVGLVTIVRECSKIGFRKVRSKSGHGLVYLFAYYITLQSDRPSEHVYHATRGGGWRF